MISYAEALSKLLDIEELPTISISTNESSGYIAAETIISQISVPSFANSAMDGFAICSSDIAAASEENPVILKIVGSTMAGDKPASGAGGAWEIMTGAIIPDGYDTVVKIEDVSINGDEVLFTKPTQIHHNIRDAGEDFISGDKIIEKGTAITPMHIMALAAIGQETITVASKPKITVISTGKEIIDDNNIELLSGQIRNSNSPYLISALKDMGITAQYGGIIHDEPEIFERKIKDRLKGNNIIISTGAVSAGKHDFIPDSLRKLGAEIIFHKVAIRPGKPILYARFHDDTPLGGTHYFGLPGNPVSAIIGLRFFVIPLIRKLQNMEVEQPITARLLMPSPKKQGLRFFRKAYVSVAQGGKLQLDILKGQESFKINSLLKANCWAVFTEEHNGVEIGDAIEIYPLEPNKWNLGSVTWLN